MLMYVLSSFLYLDKQESGLLPKELGRDNKGMNRRVQACVMLESVNGVFIGAYLCEYVL